MKIEKRENIKGNIKNTVIFDGEKYIRLQKDVYGGLVDKSIVQWKKLKTNHLVKAEKHKLLEEKFKEVDNTSVKPNSFKMKGGASGTTMLFDFKSVNTKEEKTVHEKRIDERILEHIKFGNLLTAVKYYKEVSGLGLKEAKDYVDLIYVNYFAEKKWDKAMTFTKLHEKTLK